MTRAMIPHTAFVLVAVRHEGRCLVVQEAKEDRGFYLPAGGVEPGEDLTAAAVRETLEEAGIHVRVTGLMGIDHGVPAHGAGAVKLRFFLTADAYGDLRPKTEHDHHSLGARWVTTGELAALPLRDREVLDVYRRLEAGAAVLPWERYRSYVLA